jgi:hypothetical protein
MPIVVTNKQFNDNFSNTLSYYQSNVGDRQSVVLTVESNIRISSVGNPILFDLTTNQLTSSSQSWLEEGFRDGDSITLTKYDSSGTVLITWNATVQWVNDSILDVSIMQTSGYDIANGEIFEVIVTGRNRDDLDLFFNHVPNGQIGSEFSLLDGEATRIIFTGVDSLAVSGAINGILPPNQSGQCVISSSIQRLADPATGTKKYNVSVDFTTTGFYQSSLFNSSNCVKVYIRLEWASISGEPFDRSEYIFNDDANTGFLNEAFNNGIPAITLVQGIDELDYCNPTTHDIIIDGLVTDLGVGAAYVSLDDNYFKNQTTPGQDQLMLAPSSNVFLAPFPWTLTSNANQAGANYLIDINSVNTVGTQTTINITFTPQPLFNTFMAGRDDGDRLFYLWIKGDNVNLTAFSDQLTCEPPVGGPLIMESNARFLDHSQNFESLSGNLTQREHNIEDDIAFFGTFKVDKGDELTGLNVFVEAYNITSGADFTLQQSNCDFSTVQISSDGRYLLDEAQTIVSSLPSNSKKRESKLKLYPSLDNLTEYGISIYYPFLLRWEYWLDQANANVDFYPDQNKNWFPYDSTGDWTVRLRVQLIKEGLAYTHTENVDILDYNNTSYIATDIELYVDSTNQNVPIVVENGLMRVVGTHRLTNGSSWDQSTVWGMITVEPTESAPRFICSSVLAFDNNNLNPLTPLDNVQMNVTFPAVDTARMECYFNPDKINLTNGCKFTSKIKGCITDEVIEKTMTDGTTKTTTGGTNKTIAN